MNVRQGQVWLVTSDMAVRGLTHWRAPFTDGFKCILPAGTRVQVTRAWANTTAAACRPIEYDAMERLLVPSKDRQDPKYDGYTLVLDLEDFGRMLTPADEG
jgi:hypothetical protein